jgi:hypothetical protein
MQTSADVLKYYLSCVSAAGKDQRQAPFERLCTDLVAELLQRREVYVAAGTARNEDGTDRYLYRYAELGGRGTVLPVFTSLEEANKAGVSQPLRVRLENVARDCIHYTDLAGLFFNAGTDKILLKGSLLENLYAVADGLDRKDIQTIQGQGFHARGLQTPYRFLVLEGSQAASLEPEAPQDLKDLAKHLQDLGLIRDGGLSGHAVFDSAHQAARFLSGQDDPQALWRFELVEAHPIRPYYRRPGLKWEGVLTATCPDNGWVRQFDLRQNDVEELLEKAAADLQAGTYGQEATALADRIALHGGKLECAKVIAALPADADHPADLACALALTLITDDGQRTDLPVLTQDGRIGTVVPFEALKDYPCPAGGGRLVLSHSRQDLS